jgi:hypothetical protein
VYVVTCHSFFIDTNVQSQSGTSGGRSGNQKGHSPNTSVLSYPYHCTISPYTVVPRLTSEPANEFFG